MARRVALALVLVALSAATAAAPAGAAARCGATHWVGAWGAAPSNAVAPGYTDATLRLVVAPHLGGHTVRVRLTNRLGLASLTIGRAGVARRSSGANLVAGTARRLTFGGRPGVTIPRGAEAISDAVRLRVRPFQDLAVSLHLPGATGPLTTHQLATESSTYVASGDRVAGAGAGGFGAPVPSWPVVHGVDVLASGRTGAVVAFGDSITDGYRSEVARAAGARNTRWPDVLARRLGAAGRPLSVVNQGISGNRIRLDGLAEIFGPNALSRVVDDVLGTPGASTAIVLEGINDIGQMPEASAADVIAGLQQLVARLRHAGLRVLVGTLTPSGSNERTSYSGAAADATRTAVNRWIRRSGVPDGVVDFDVAVRDPAVRRRLRPRFDSGDGLHPNARGYRAMGEAVALGALRGPVCR